MASLLNIDPKIAQKSLFEFTGTWRRLEKRGVTEAGTVVYDDYAHHPTEIRATLAAFKKQFPERPLVCVFQPHQGKRLELLFKEFTAAFDIADAVILLPLYKVRGRDEKFPRESSDLANAIKRHTPKKPVAYLENPKHLQAVLNNLSISRSPLIVMMGAGDIVDHTEKLLSFR